MSMIAKCAQCDSPLDPYGRDGGHSFCRKCIEAIPERFVDCGPDPLRHIEPRARRVA